MTGKISGERKVKIILLKAMMYLSVFVTCAIVTFLVIYVLVKYSLQGTTQGRYLTGGVPPVRFSM